MKKRAKKLEYFTDTKLLDKKAEASSVNKRLKDFESLGITLGQTDSSHLPIFLSSLPLGLTKDYFEVIQGNPFKLFADQASKSVLLNYKVLNAHTRGDRIFITDIGGSYEPYCTKRLRRRFK